MCLYLFFPDVRAMLSVAAWLPYPAVAKLTAATLQASNARSIAEISSDSCRADVNTVMNSCLQIDKLKACCERLQSAAASSPTGRSHGHPPPTSPSDVYAAVVLAFIAQHVAISGCCLWRIQLTTRVPSTSAYGVRQFTMDSEIILKNISFNSLRQGYPAESAAEVRPRSSNEGAALQAIEDCDCLDSHTSNLQFAKGENGVAVDTVEPVDAAASQPLMLSTQAAAQPSAISSSVASAMMTEAANTQSMSSILTTSANSGTTGYTGDLNVCVTALMELPDRGDSSDAASNSSRRTTSVGRRTSACHRVFKFLGHVWKRSPGNSIVAKVEAELVQPLTALQMYEMWKPIQQAKQLKAQEKGFTVDPWPTIAYLESVNAARTYRRTVDMTTAGDSDAAVCEYGFRSLSLVNTTTRTIMLKPLELWVASHLSNPYAEKAEMLQLCIEIGLARMQCVNFLRNRRRYMLQSYRRQAKQNLASPSCTDSSDVRNCSTPESSKQFRGSDRTLRASDASDAAASSRWASRAVTYQNTKTRNKDLWKQVNSDVKSGSTDIARRAILEEDTNQLAVQPRVNPSKHIWRRGTYQEASNQIAHGTCSTSAAYGSYAASTGNDDLTPALTSPNSALSSDMQPSPSTPAPTPTTMRMTLRSRNSTRSAHSVFSHSSPMKRQRAGQSGRATTSAAAHSSSSSSSVTSYDTDTSDSDDRDAVLDESGLTRVIANLRHESS